MTAAKRCFRTSTAALAIAVATLASPALAGKAGINSMSFGTAPYWVPATIRVISTDKQKWDAFKPGAMNFTANMAIDTKHPGLVAQTAIVLGDCSDSSCLGMPVLFGNTVLKRDYSASETVSFQASTIPISGTGITLGDQIIAVCNAKLQADGPTKTHSFVHTLPATWLVDSDEKWVNVHKFPVEAGPGPGLDMDVDHTRTALFDVNVVCEPVVKQAADDIKHDLGDFEVEKVRLFLTTYQNQQPGSNAGTVCPALKVTSRAETSRSGPVQMRIWRQKNGGPITDTVVDAWASYDAGKNGYFATWEDFEDVGTTSHFQFRTEVVSDDIFAPFDGWKDITVHCSGAGGGGFATEPDDNPDLPKPKAKWAGTMAIADSAGRDKSCPRKGQVFFEVTRPEPGNFDYRISCSNGAYFEGTAIGYDQGSGVFEAYGAHDLSINRTRNIQCTLQEMTPAPVTVAVDTEAFTCNNPAMEPEADDLVDAPRPNPKKPDVTKPGIVVAPLPTCDRGERLVRGKCVDKPGISILCKPGYVLKGKSCLKKPEVSILCKQGFVLKGKTCVRKPDVSILCAPGYVLKGKACIKKPVIVAACEKGQKLVRGACVDRPDVKPIKRLKGKLEGKKRAFQPKLPALKVKPSRIN